MKINATRLYTALFVIVLFSQIYLPSFKANVFLQIAVLGLYLFIEKPSVSANFFKQLQFLTAIFCIGFLGFVIHKYVLFNVIKDIFHFIKPLLGILIGYLIFRKINDFKFFIKTIILCGMVSAIVHFVILLTVGNVFMGDVSEIREYGKDNFLELFALFFLIFYKRFQKENIFQKKIHHQSIAIILIISNVFYFSRTMIVVAIILLFTIYGFTILTQRIIRIMGIFILSIALLYTYLYSVKIERGKPGIEAFLYKIKIAPAELFKTKIDRENHKDLWDHWRGYEAKRAYALMEKSPSSFIFGCGYGSLVNLKFFAPLDQNNEKGMKFISELHNGYMYLFYKTGIIGIIIYLYFLFGFYNFINRYKDINAYFISAIGLIFIFTTLTITGIYNTKDVIIIILGAMIFFQDKTQKAIVT